MDLEEFAVDREEAIVRAIVAQRLEIRVPVVDGGFQIAYAGTFSLGENVVLDYIDTLPTA